MKEFNGSVVVDLAYARILSDLENAIDKLRRYGLGFQANRLQAIHDELLGR